MGQRFYSSKLWKYYAVNTIIALLLFGVVCNSYGLTSQKIYRVLYINSYRPGYLWSDNILKGMQSVFTKYENIEFDTIFLDSKTHLSNDYLDIFVRLLIQKYKNKKLDVVITSDDNAYNFYKKHRNEIAPEIPWIFCGINHISPDNVSRKDKIYGIDENRSVKKNIDMIMTIQPNVKNIVIVSDLTTTGKALSNEARKLRKYYSNKVKFKFVDDVTSEELCNILNTLSPESVVFLLVFAKDKNGQCYYDSGKSIVLKNSAVPVYAFGDFSPNSKFLGGVITVGYDYGKLAAMQAIKLITNKQNDSTPLIQYPPLKSIVNYDNLKRFNLHNNFLPNHYVVLNKPKSLYLLYKEYKATMLSILFLILCLISIIIALAINIRLRKQTQKQLESEEERLRTTLYSIGDAVISTDNSGCIMAMNRMAEKLTGWTFHEASGKNIDKVLNFLDTTDDTGQSIHFSKRMSISGSNLQLNGYVIAKATKHKSMVHGSVNRILNLSDEVVGHVFVLHDITEQHKTEMLLQQSQKMDSLGQLAGGVAHDFNNMLFAILGSANLISKRVGDNEKLKKLVRNIINSSERASDLVAQLLMFSRKSKDVQNTLDVNKMIEDVISILLHSISKNIIIDSHLNATPANVIGDATRLQNAIINLGINARDAMPSGGKLSIGTSNIFLDSSADPHMLIDSKPGYYVQIDVSDTGLGIPRENINKIFDPFFTTKEVGKGTGLGLSIIYSTIKDMNGTIHVYSEEGKGTAFKIFLPLAGQDDISSHMTDSVEQLITGKGNILIIDDEELVRCTIENTLEECGYTYISAENGAEGLKRFSKYADSIDLVMLDMIMPGLSVNEIYEALVEIKPDVKILLMSGFASSSSIEEMSKKCPAFLSKPFSPGKLSKTLKDLLK